MPSEAFLHLVSTLSDREVRFVMIGVWAANYYARSGAEVFSTEDRYFFLPPDAGNLLRAWVCSRDEGFTSWGGEEPLDQPLDLHLAKRVVEQRSLTSAIHPTGVVVDFALGMSGFDFDTVWQERRVFRVEDVEVPVARLAHIIESKSRAGRTKDRLFLATYEERLRHMLKDDDRDS